MHRHVFRHDGLTFSYLDNGVSGPVVVFLHGHFMGASDFDEVIHALSDRWRCLALDQRGHGETEHTTDHTQLRYIADVRALLDHLQISAPVTVVGHSFGGEVAYLFAAAHPERVDAMVIEDMNVVRDDHNDFIRNWAGVFSDRKALEARLGSHLTPYLQKSIRETESGWTLTFEPEEMLRSEVALNGDHWREWLASKCPALIIRGEQSPLVPGEDLEEMARRRPRTQLISIDAGHSVHVDNPGAYIAALRNFLIAQIVDR